MKRKNKKIKWYKQAEEHDYPAAESYLKLIYGTDIIPNIIKGLKSAPIVYFKAKDIFRASQTTLLPESNFHVAKNLAKIRKGKKMSPLLLVKNTKNNSTIIADGFHRLSAVYAHNEDILIPCKIV